MKIAVIGANGKAGRLIAYEAYRRGHEVTAIVRDAEKLPGCRYHLLEKDLFDLTAADIRGFDAVISAFGLPFDGKHADDAYQKAYGHLISVFEQAPDVRLLVVGGAASLYQDDTKSARVLDSFPKERRKDPEDMFRAWGLLEKSKVKYTFFSPAVFFDPRGGKTRSYQRGTDTVIRNSAGDSYISYGDYAIAMVDEAERGNYVRGRFTAVSERKPKKERPYLGIRPEKPVFEGLSQYREPFCFELAGMNLLLAMDDGKRYAVTFIDGHTLRWGELGAVQTVEYYDCAKAGDAVYFVNFELAAASPRTNIRFVADLEERLVTLVTTVTGYHPKFPYMVDSRVVFGAIDLPGFPLPARRHRYTADLLGKRIHWHYGPDFEIVHVYYATDYIRVTMPENRGWAEIDEEDWNELIDREPYDEPAFYIKLKPGLYLVGCMEKNMACRGMTGNSMLFVIDTKRVHDVGRSFGHAGLETGQVRPENYLYGAFGEFVKSDGVLESMPNIYREKQVH